MIFQGSKKAPQLQGAIGMFRCDLEMVWTSIGKGKRNVEKSMEY